MSTSKSTSTFTPRSSTSPTTTTTITTKPAPSSPTSSLSSLISIPPFPPRASSVTPASPASPVSYPSPSRLTTVKPSTTDQPESPAPSGPRAKQSETPRSSLSADAKGNSYSLSPVNIHARHCRCALASRRLTGADDYLEYMIRRVEKAWLRLEEKSSTTPPPPELVALAHGVWRSLRDRGHELFHIAVSVLAIPSSPRRMTSVIWLVPSGADEDESTGHRIVAEIVVSQVDRTYSGETQTSFGGVEEEHKKSTRKVDRVLARFAEDWDEWLGIPQYTYEGDLTGGIKPFVLDVTASSEMVTGKTVVGRLFTQVVHLLGDGVSFPAKEFTLTLARATNEINQNGEQVTSFHVEPCLRHKVGKDISLPPARCVQVSLWAGLGDQAQRRAVLVVDLWARPNGGKVNTSLSVHYNEDNWKVEHMYRSFLPRPDLSRLSPLVTEGRMRKRPKDEMRDGSRGQ